MPGSRSGSIPILSGIRQSLAGYWMAWTTSKWNTGLAGPRAACKCSGSMLILQMMRWTIISLNYTASRPKISARSHLSGAPAVIIFSNHLIDFALSAALYWTRVWQKKLKWQVKRCLMLWHYLWLTPWPRHWLLRKWRKWSKDKGISTFNVFLHVFLNLWMTKLMKIINFDLRDLNT